MNKNVREGVRGGSRTTQPVNPGGLSQYGTAVGGKLKQHGSFTGVNSAKPVFEGAKTAPVPLGNSLTNNVGKGGPGTGRTLYGQSGMQQMHGAPVQGQAPGRRDILSEYGRDAPAASMVHKR
jgi:hypothetical protein